MSHPDFSCPRCGGPVRGEFARLVTSQNVAILHPVVACHACRLTFCPAKAIQTAADQRAEELRRRSVRPSLN